MRIQAIEAAQFGVLNIEQRVDFRPGLNLWISPNQAGKTTALTYLEWMLYGPQAARGQRDTAALKRWTPWSGAAPGGRLLLQPELPDWPRDLLVSARFADSTVQLIDAASKQVLDDRLTVAKSGEWDLGLRLLNLSRDSFRLSLQALQETLIEPLRGTSLRQMVTSDLGKLVENPDAVTIERLLAVLESPSFRFGDGPERTIREHKIEVTKELDILALEHAQLGQRLDEFRQLLSERDELAAQLKQQERVVQGLERQAHSLEMARNYYLLRISSQEPVAEVDSADWEREHPEYLQISHELEQEVDKLATQLEVVDQEIRHTGEELAQLEERYRAEERRLASPADGAPPGSQQLRETAVIVEQAHRDFKEACARADQLEQEIPGEQRRRFEKLEALYEPHRDNLTAIMEWQQEQLAINERLAGLRERRAELQVMSRVALPWYFYLGLLLAAFSWLPVRFTEDLGPYSWITWVMMTLILVIAALLIYPYWKLRRATGPAAQELRDVVRPAIDEGISKLAAQDRRRRRFAEMYEIDRNTWDQLVDNIMEYTQLGLRMREYSAAQRDVEMLKRRRDTAWVTVGEIHPLAPPGVDIGWLREQLELVGGPTVARDTLSTLSARIEENRKDLARLTAQREQYAVVLNQKLAPVGFGAQLQAGLKEALSQFRQVALSVRKLRARAERHTIYEESMRGIAMDEEEFETQWRQLGEGDRAQLSRLVATSSGYETACTRLKELATAQREAVAAREKLREAFDLLRDQLAKYGQIDREARRMKERRAAAEERQLLLERWEKALEVTRRIIDTLVTSAGQQAAPEIGRELRKTLSRAPIPGVRNIDLGPNLEVLVELDGAPASIPPRELWTYLSTGAQKQVALALRLSMARTASGRTSLPLLLDEPLEELDDERAALVFEYITQLAQSTQVLIMSSHERLYRWLLEQHPEVHELAITAP